MRVHAALGAALALVVAEGSARGEPQPPRVIVEAPRDCTTPSAFISEVEAGGGDVRPRESGAPVVIELVVRPVGQEFFGELRLSFGSDRAEVRRVTGARCKEVVGALALTAALSLDRDLASRAPLPLLPPFPAARPRGEPPRATPRARETRISVLAESRATSNGALGVTLALGAATEWSFPGRGAFEPSLRLGASRTAAASASVAPGWPASFTFTTAELAFCPMQGLLGAGISLRPCLAVEGGLLEATVAPPLVATETRRPWFATNALLAARILPRAPIALEVVGGVAIPVIRDNFHFDGTATVFRAPPLLPFAGLAVGARFL